MGLCSLIPNKTYMYNSLMQNKIISSTETDDSHQCFETMDIAGINKRSLSFVRTSFYQIENMLCKILFDNYINENNKGLFIH